VPRPSGPKELAVTGHPVRLWRPVSQLRSIGIWRADDETELREKVLGTLPLRPWMILVVTPNPTPTTLAIPEPPRPAICGCGSMT
jgi:muconolactone delta-isomerase